VVLARKEEKTMNHYCLSMKQKNAHWMVEAAVEIPANHRRGTVNVQFTSNLVQSRHFCATTTPMTRREVTREK